MSSSTCVYYDLWFVFAFLVKLILCTSIFVACKKLTDHVSYSVVSMNHIMFSFSCSFYFTILTGVIIFYWFLSSLETCLIFVSALKLQLPTLLNDSKTFFLIGVTENTKWLRRLCWMMNNIKLFLSKDAAVKYCCFIEFQEISFYSFK